MQAAASGWDRRRVANGTPVIRGKQASLSVSMVHSDCSAGRREASWLEDRPGILLVSAVHAEQGMGVLARKPAAERRLRLKQSKLSCVR
jgi:hypothetical protein